MNKIGVFFSFFFPDHGAGPQEVGGGQPLLQLPVVHLELPTSLLVAPNRVLALAEQHLEPLHLRAAK